MLRKKLFDVSLGEALGVVGLEGLTCISILAKADPKIITALFAISLAGEFYLGFKACSFFYETFRRSVSLRDFLIQLDVPILSAEVKKTTPSMDNLMASLERSVQRAARACNPSC